MSQEPQLPESLCVISVNYLVTTIIVCTQMRYKLIDRSSRLGALRRAKMAEKLPPRLLPERLNTPSSAGYSRSYLCAVLGSR